MSYLSSKPFVYPLSLDTSKKYLNAFAIFLSENLNHLIYIRDEKTKNEQCNNKYISDVTELQEGIKETLKNLKSNSVDIRKVGRYYVEFVENLTTIQLLKNESNCEKYRASLRLLSTFKDENGNSPLMLAAENGWIGSLNFLIKWRKEEKIINDFNNNNKTAADLVWEILLNDQCMPKSSECKNNKYYDCLLALVKNESLFPNDKGLDKYLHNFKELEIIKKDREKLHMLIETESIEEIKEYFLRNERLRYYFNTQHHSALYSALLSQSYEAYALLKSKGCNLKDSEEGYLKELGEEIKDKIKSKQKRYYEKPEAAHISYLISKSEGFLGKAENCEKVERWYKYLDSIEEISPLLKIITLSDKLNNICFDFYKSTIVEIEHGGCDDLGICKYEDGCIYIAVDNEEQHVVGTLIHELTHFALQVIFGNDCKPHYEEDEVSKNIFDNICLAVENRKGKIDNIISRVFTSYKDRSQWSAELIVRVPHMLATYSYKQEMGQLTADCTTSREILRQQVPELQNFYENMINYVKDNSDRLIEKFKIGCLNKKLKTIDEIKNYQIKFKNVINIQRFLETVDKKILIIADSSVLLSSINVLQTLKGLPEEYHRSYVFCENKHLTDMETKEIIDNLKSNETCSMLIVKCEDNVNWNRINEKFKMMIKTDSIRKMIFVVNDQDSCLINSLKNDYDCKVKMCGKEENLDVEFTNLPNEIQKRFLHTKVTFQGETIPLCNLIEDKNAENVINVNMMEKIIKGENIEIGNRVLDMSDLHNFAYHKVFTRIDVNLLKKSLHEENEDDFVIDSLVSDDMEEENDDVEEDNDLLVVSGARKDELAKILEISETKIQDFNEIYTNKNIDFQVILLQGKEYDDNYEKFRKVCSMYNKRTVHFIECQNNEFVWNCYYNPYYIPRKFLPKVVDMRKLKIHACKRNTRRVPNVFVIAGLSEKSELAPLFSEDEIGISTENVVNEKRILMLKGENQESSFFKLCESLENVNIHLIEAVKKKKIVFLWKRSVGDISIVRELLMENSNELFNTCNLKNKFLEVINENSFLNLVTKENHVVIQDLAGMGKTTTLTMLAQEYHEKYPQEWILRIDFKEYGYHINDLPDNLSTDSVTKFFTSFSRDGILTSLLRHSFFEKGNVLVLFDGFDEISPLQQEKVTSLMKFLKENTKVKLVVTTRPHVEKVRNLENTLSVIAINFQPISVNECKKFLKNFWINALKFKYDVNDKEFQDSCFFNTLLRKFRKSINDKHLNFMGVPLQSQMFAEVYLTVENFEHYRYKKSTKEIEKLFKKVNILHLYENFIKRKYQIYFDEKNRFGTLISNDDKTRLEESFHKDHQHLAAQYWYRNLEYLTSPPDFFRQYFLNTDSSLELNRIGITQSTDNEILFIHHTFAEYFLSEFIFDKFDKLKYPKYTKWYKHEVMEYLLGYIFCAPCCNIVRKFINYKFCIKGYMGVNNYLLPYEEASHTYVKSISNEFILSLLHSFNDSGYLFVMPLRVIIKEGLLEILYFLFCNTYSVLDLEKLRLFIEYLKSSNVLKLLVEKGYYQAICYLIHILSSVPRVRYDEELLSLFYYLLTDTMAFRNKKIIRLFRKYVDKKTLIDHIDCKTTDVRLRQKLIDAVEYSTSKKKSSS